MRLNEMKKSLSLIFCMMLIVAMALFTIGCNDKKEGNLKTKEETPLTMEEAADAVQGTVYDEVVLESEKAEIIVLGEGENQFLFTVVDKEGIETVFEIHTDKEIVGEALLDLGLIDGENGEFGLYVKTVNGIVADYEVDSTYWAFYVNGEYAMSGVDSTKIEEGSSYTFKVEK